MTENSDSNINKRQLSFAIAGSLIVGAGVGYFVANTNSSASCGPGCFSYTIQGSGSPGCYKIPEFIATQQFVPCN